MTPFLVFLLLMAWPALALADSVEIVWDPATGATGYDVQRSSDFNYSTGAGTWTVVGTVTSCTGTPIECKYMDSNAPAGAAYRIVTKNASGATIVAKRGVWYCGICVEPPGKPTSVGVTP